MGKNATIDTLCEESISIGSSANVMGGSYGCAIGSSTIAQSGAVSVGHGAQTGVESVAIGYTALSDLAASHVISIGAYAQTSGYGSTSIGYKTKAWSEKSICIGYESEIDTHCNNSIVIGHSARAYELVEGIDGDFDVVPEANAVNAIAIGLNARALGHESVCIGSTSQSGEKCTLVGSNSRARGKHAVVLGWACDAKADQAICIGNNAIATNTGLYINPIRSDVKQSKVLYYNTTDKEITYAEPITGDGVTITDDGTGVLTAEGLLHGTSSLVMADSGDVNINVGIVLDNTTYSDDPTTIISGGHDAGSALLIRRGDETQSTHVYPYTMIECHAVHEDHIDTTDNETNAGTLINETNLFGFVNMKFKTTQGGSGIVGGSTVAAFPVVTYIASGHGYFNSNDPTNHSKTTHSEDRRRDSNIAFFTSRDNANLGAADDQTSEKDPKLAMLITPDGRVGIGGAKNVTAMLQIQQRHGDSDVADRNRLIPFISFMGSVNTDAGADTEIGSIVRSGNSNVLYNTTSDYRLKKNISSYSGGLDVVNALIPKIFNFITESDDSEKTTGFIAHEVNAVAKGVVTGEKDAVYEDGRPRIQQIDHSKLVPYLVSAVKELKAENDTIKAENAAIKADIAAIKVHLGL